MAGRRDFRPEAQIHLWSSRPWQRRRGWPAGTPCCDIPKVSRWYRLPLHRPSRLIYKEESCIVGSEVTRHFSSFSPLEGVCAKCDAHADDQVPPAAWTTKLRVRHYWPCMRMCMCIIIVPNLLCYDKLTIKKQVRIANHAHLAMSWNEPITVSKLC